MPFDGKPPYGKCPVCGLNANIRKTEFNVPAIVDCPRCGDYSVSKTTSEDAGLPFTKPTEQALASHLIRKLQAGGSRPVLDDEFFKSLKTRTLPTPAELRDSLLQTLAEMANGSPGTKQRFAWNDPGLLATIGTIASHDLGWILDSLIAAGLVIGANNGGLFVGNLSGAGWLRYDELKRATVASRFAFFARKFINPDLDKVFTTCLRQAVLQTGFELRIVTQKAGLVDAIIEDEIRRCRFLIADVTDENPGAYWEAGFAEGLGKKVIYICRTKSKDYDPKIHFDANHRQTVPWDLNNSDETAKHLKAVITLLGDAIQTD
jgi:hypothetical protein